MSLFLNIRLYERHKLQKIYSGHMIFKFANQLYNNAAVLLCLATLGFAGNTIAGKLAVGEVSPMMIVFLRWAIVTLLLLSFHWKKLLREITKIKKRLIWILLMGGVGLTGFNSLFYVAAQYTSSINIGIIQCTMPGFVVLGTIIFHKRVVSTIQVLGLFVTMLAVIIIVGEGELDTILSLTGNIGDLIMLAGCLFYAGYNIGLGNRPALDPLTMMAFFSFAALITSVPILFIEFLVGSSQWPTANGWGIVIYVALIPAFLSQVFFMRGVDLIGPGEAGLYHNLVPIFTAVLGISILGEVLHVFHVVSLFLVFGGIYAFKSAKKYKRGKIMDT